MTNPHFTAMPTAIARAFQSGAPDANGQPPERHISDGEVWPCRHCLGGVEEGDPYLILAYRPFPTPQPYAEIGPIFLHADSCSRYPEAAEVPPMLESERYLIRGYNAQDRIEYGTGQIVPTPDIPAAAAKLFERPEIAYIHVRSASNNCYQCRIDR